MNKMTRGLGVLMVLLAVPATACLLGCDEGRLRGHWSFAGSCSNLVEADTGGAPADAVAWLDGGDTLVRVWSEEQNRGQRILLHRASLDAMGVGLHRATPEAMLADETIDFEIASCAGPSIDEPVCVRTEAQEIEIVDLGDGTRRATYRADVVRADGTVEVTHGTFVFELPGVD